MAKATPFLRSQDLRAGGAALLLRKGAILDLQAEKEAQEAATTTGSYTPLVVGLVLAGVGVGGYFLYRRFSQ